jgi:hypothetical protein
MYGSFTSGLSLSFQIDIWIYRFLQLQRLSMANAELSLPA